ncbi:MAG: hypothetical protein ACRDFC_08970, partial [Ignavibacteria bacterium]
MSRFGTLIYKDKLTFKHKIGLLLISLSTLMLEFTLIRVLSVSLWYHFAFMIISIALLGFGISGVTLAVSDKIHKSGTSNLLTIISFIFALAILISFYLTNKIPFDPFSLLVDNKQFLYLPAYYLLITLPFFLSGLIIGILFSRFKMEINKLYFFDLAGAGLSCFVFIWVLPMYGGSGGVIAASIIAVLATISFATNITKFRTTVIIA